MTSKFSDVRLLTWQECQNEEGQLNFPKNMSTILLEELVEFLEDFRDQSLWFSIIDNLNYDHGEIVSSVAEWILDQDDCDVAIAVLAFGHLSGDYFCGLSKPEDSALSLEFLRPLRVIECRERTRPFGGDTLKVSKRHFSNGDQSELLESCKHAVSKLPASPRADSSEKGLISVPTKILNFDLNGSEIPEKYVVFDSGPMVVPKNT